MEKIKLNIKIFFEGAYLSYVGLFRWLRPATYFATLVFSPLTQMLFFVLIGTYADGSSHAYFYVIGNALMNAAMSGIYGVTMSIGGERWSGTLPYLFGAPANRMSLFIGRAFMHILNGMVGVVTGLLWGWLLFNMDYSATSPWALFLTILVTTFSTAGLGLLMGCIGLITRNVMFVNNTVYFILLLFSGANLELSSLPVWMQVVSKFLPLTRGIASARLIIAGHSLAEVGSLLLEELAIGTFYALLGYTLFRWFEFVAKKRGTLEVF
ncbi:MAG TPA: hypothetical protein DCK95_06005 [Anaerolineaceae bacterium]|nr:hypothetical protein [Anaerolineaceae bacterium]